MVAEDRWRQSFKDFDRAVVLLREPIERGIETLSQLEREGTVRRFIYTLELACKTLQDYLEYEGMAIQTITPRSVTKEAFAARILSDGQVWIDMLDHRNLLAHTHDADTLEKAACAIRDRYHPTFEELHAWYLELGVDLWKAPV